jgi:hypothetical protein
VPSPTTTTTHGHVPGRHPHRTIAYKGLHGEGNESENPPTYSVVYLTGKSWR